jgi:pimeloyl-ACP methyl ester carboxylesterase
LVVVVSFVCGCDAKKTNPGAYTGGTDSPATLQAFAERFDVGGYRLFLNCRGTGTPTVIFEAGLDSPGEVWGPVQDRVSERARACWYDRAGTGRSENRPKERITSRVLAGALGRLLRAARVPPPYVLVAHSIGGFTARLFAAAHPDEVDGLVLVDTTASDWPTLRQELPEGNSILDARASGAEVEGARLESGNPLVVVRHGQPEEGFTSEEEQRFTRAQERLARSTGNGLAIVALQSGHEIPTVQPELVALVIHSVVVAARPAAPKLACPAHLDRVEGQCAFATASA